MKNVSKMKMGVEHMHLARIEELPAMRQNTILRDKQRSHENRVESYRVARLEGRVERLETLSHRTY